MAGPMAFLSEQFASLPYPTDDFSNQTIIVTGSNIGLGLEAARHITRLNAAKVILAVRTLEKGEAAKKDIEQSTKRTGAVEVWQLDLSSFESVKQFARRAQGLKRLDAVVENAGIAVRDFVTVDGGNESTVMTNVLGTFLLALLLLPKLRETAQNYNITPRIVILSSGVHYWTQFPESKNKDIYAALNNPSTAEMQGRYPVSKIMDVLLTRELAARISASGKPKVIVSTVDPGLCHSSLTRDAKGLMWLRLYLLKTLLARTTEKGARTLVHAAAAGDETHGQYLASCVVKEPSAFVLSDTGKEVQKRLWDQTLQKLEAVQPGVSKNV